MGMARISIIVDAILFYLLAVALGVVVGICFVQVVARYIFSASLAWAEEISIIILLWGTWGAACLAVKQGIHLRVRILEERLTLRTSLTLRLTLNCLAILSMAVTALTSKIIISAMAHVTLMSLPSLPMNIMYISVPMGSVLMIYYLLRVIASDLKSIRKLGQEDR
jgi:TRAP-type C4-dicarboxylate transport system permease small subunit